MRPSLLQRPGGHTISRRSAAEGCADAPLLPSNTARRTASTLTNASDQLSGSNRAVVRAECTAAVPLAQWKQQPNQPSQHDEHEAALFGRGSAFRVSRVRDTRQCMLSVSAAVGQCTHIYIYTKQKPPFEFRRE